MNINAHVSRSPRAPALVRAGVHYYKDEAEVERFVCAVAGKARL